MRALRTWKLKVNSCNNFYLQFVMKQLDSPKFPENLARWLPVQSTKFFLVFPDNFLWLDRDMTQQTFIFALGFYKGLLLQGLNKPCSMAPCTSHRWLFCQRKYFFPGGPKYCEKVSPYFSLSGVEKWPVGWAKTLDSLDKFSDSCVKMKILTSFLKVQ